jgi:hypothetical protein
MSLAHNSMPFRQHILASLKRAADEESTVSLWTARGATHEIRKDHEVVVGADFISYSSSNQQNIVLLSHIEAVQIKAP